MYIYIYIYIHTHTHTYTYVPHVALVLLDMLVGICERILVYST